MYFGYSSRDNLPLTVKFGANSAYVVENNYDELTRLRFKTYTLGSSTAKINTSYSYLDWTNDKGTSDKIRTTGTVRGIDYTYVAEGLSTHDRWYTYDNVGNILTECSWISSSSKPVQESYTYDAKNQLVKHDSVTLNATFTYTYDVAGNIKSKTIYNKDSGATSTINYIYGNSAWGDELTSYNGESIVYDKIGNPTSYRGWGMTWQGRQLTKAVKDKTVTFTYDSEGIRTSKSNGTNTTKYLLNGTQILAQTTNGKTLCFFYDQQGNRVGMADGNNHFYYYIYNVQGDVIALADASTGKLAATYTYDAWGKCTVTNASGYTIGTQNPFRYRGYYYDTETSLYYLQSRYYDPEVGRFINADAFASTDISSPLSTNMFAYCENNPVTNLDSDGESPTLAIMAIGGLVGAGINFVSSIISQKQMNGAVNLKSAAVAAATGFVSGAISASPLGRVGQIIAGGVTSGLSYAADCAVNNKSFNMKEAAGSALMGALSGGLGGNGSNYKNVLTDTINGTKKVVVREMRRENKKYANKVIKSAVASRNNTLALSFWSGSASFTLGCGISNRVSCLFSRWFK